MENLSFKGEYDNGKTRVNVKIGIYLFIDDNTYIAYCPALDLSGYGTTEKEAKDSFEQSFRMYIEYCLNKNTLVKDLQSHGWGIKSMKQKRIKSPDVKSMIERLPDFREVLENKNYVKYTENMGIPMSV